MPFLSWRGNLVSATERIMGDGMEKEVKIVRCKDY